MAISSVTESSPPIVAPISFKYHDLRIKVGNNMSLDSQSKLHEEVCPHNMPPIACSRDTVEVTYSPHLAHKGQVSFLRRVKKRIMFTSQQPHKPLQPDYCGPAVHVIVVYTECTHQEGQDLKEVINIADISIDIDTGPIQAWIEKKITFADFSMWLEAVLTEITRISETIREQWM